MNNSILRSFREFATLIPKRVKVEILYLENGIEEKVEGLLGTDGSIQVGRIVVPLMEISAWMKSMHRVEFIGIKEVER